MPVAIKMAGNNPPWLGNHGWPVIFGIDSLIILPAVSCSLEETVPYRISNVFIGRDVFLMLTARIAFLSRRA